MSNVPSTLTRFSSKLRMSLEDEETVDDDFLHKILDQPKFGYLTPTHVVLHATRGDD